MLFFVCISFVCANTIYVSPSTVSVSRGDSFEILVNASTSTSDIYAVQFDLNYDSSILTLDSVSEGEFFSSDGATTIFNYSSFGFGFADNVLNVRNETYESPTPGITGDGSVAVFSFTASTAGTSAITLSNVLWMNSTITNESAEEISPLINSGSVDVVSPPCVITDAYWVLTSAMEGQSVTLIVTGDNCEGKELNFTVMEDDWIFGDDNVNIEPVNVNFIGNTATTNWIAEWVNDAVWPFVGNPEYYFIATLVEDGSKYIQSNNQVSVNKLINENRVFIEPATQNVDQGQHVIINVNVNAPITASDIYGLQFDLDYDPTMLSLNSVNEGNLLSSDGNITLFNYTLALGKINNVINIRNVTFSGPPGIYSDEGTIAVFDFTAIDSGLTDVGLEEIIWVNSTITNFSVGVPGVVIENATVDINSIVSPNDVDVVLYSPLDNYVSTIDNLTFFVNVTADNDIANVSLYTDVSGSWELEYTIIPDAGSGPQVFSGNVLWHQFNNEVVYGEDFDFIYDHSGNGNDAVGISPPLDGDELTIGYFGGGYTCDGVDDYVSIASDSSYETQDFTWNFWINPGSIPAGNSYQTAMSYGVSAIRILLRDDGFIYINAGPRVGDPQSTGVSWTQDAWQMITLTSESGNTSLWIDGQLEYTDAGTGTITYDGSGLYLCQRPTGLYLNGTLDEFQIYNRILTGSEITSLYTATAGVKEFNANFTLTDIDAGIYQWNVEAYDILGNSAFAPVNYDFTIDLCGDGNIDFGEDCDGINLGGQTCLGLGYEGGSLGCASSCVYDTSSCTSSTTEYYIFDEQLENGGTFVQGPWNITSNNPYEGVNGTEILSLTGWENMDIGNLVIPTTSLDWDNSYLEYMIYPSTTAGYVTAYLRGSTIGMVSLDPVPGLTFTSGSWQRVRINLTDFALTQAEFGDTLTFFRIGATFGTSTPSYIDEIKIVSGGGETICVDSDGDGYNITGGVCGPVDCNDTNDAIHPGASEVCTDGVDNDCNGESDYDDSTLDGLPGDSACEVNIMGIAIPGPYDNFPLENSNFDVDCLLSSPLSPEVNSITARVDSVSCGAPVYVGVGGYTFTCNAGTYTGVNKTVYCEVDTDVSYSSASVLFLEIEVTQASICDDGDEDGYDNCTIGQPGDDGFEVDCDDGDDEIYPTATEICDDKDNDCDALTVDGSGESAPFNSIQDGVCVGSVQSCNSGVWQDNYLGILNYENPETSCDGLDNDCDTDVDEGLLITYYEDVDLDSYGNSSVTTSACNLPGGYAIVGGDCDDGNEFIWQLLTGYPDADSDNHYSLYSEAVCSGNVLPLGYDSTIGDDCNDSDDTIYNEALEVCDGKDNDCLPSSSDGSDEAWYGQTTNCGEGACASTGIYDCIAGSMIDTCVAGTPGTETCNGLDDDCDGTPDNGLTAPLNDLQDGVCSGSVKVCQGVVGWVNDYSGVVNYEATEISCDGLDNDCDTDVDETYTNCVGATPYCEFGSCVECIGDGDCNDGVSCTVDSCSSNVCSNLPDNSLCNNGQFCDGVEICDAVLDCLDGADPDCSSYDLPAISQCDYVPDGIGLTWDTAPFVAGVCNEISDSCEAGSQSVTSVCNILQCSAECEDNSDCAETCIGEIYYSSGSCNSGCTCDYVSGDDCDLQDGFYYNGTTVIVSLGICGEETLGGQEYRDYSCGVGGCGYSVTSSQWNSLGITYYDASTLCRASQGVCDVAEYCTGSSASCPIDSKSTVECRAASGECDAAEFCDGVNNNCPSDLMEVSGTLCGLVRDCPADSCNVFFAEFYPVDGHDSCDGLGNCIIYSCGLEDSYCTDSDSADGRNTLDCGASCDQDSDCGSGFECDLATCSCIESQCAGQVNGTFCDDGNYCNGAEECQSQICVNLGNLVDCDDDVDCTDDSCNEITDSCDNIINNTFCNDGDYCNGVEICEAVLGCQAGTIVACDDLNPCTADSCNEILDTCDNVPIDADDDQTCCEVSFDWTGNGLNLNCCGDDLGEDNPFESGIELTCDDGRDNDCDGSTDCADVDCAGSPSCISCVDSDGDGYNITGGICGPIDCDDRPDGADGIPDNADDGENINQGMTEICDDGIDNNCIDGVDCDDPACSSDPACVVGNCTITNMYWNESSVEEDDVVELIVEGTDCEGLEVSFVVLEKDGLIDDVLGGGDDPTFGRPNNATFGSGVAQTIWTTQWQDDGFRGISGDPEYYFIVNINGTDYSSDDYSGLLSVSLTMRKWQVSNITLNPGKNSFSLPLFLKNYSVTEVFKDISSSVDRIYTYDSGFKIYHFNGLPSNLEELEVGKGYIVWMNSQDVLSINGSKRDENLERPNITLIPGWNFIGTFSNSYDAQNILQGITYTELYTYNNETMVYESVSSEDYLDGERGYWINVQESGMFIPITGTVIGNE